MSTLLFLSLVLKALFLVHGQKESEYDYAPLPSTYSSPDNYYVSQKNTNGQLTEHFGGVIAQDRLVFTKDKSPYWLRNDIIIEETAELAIEPGVTIKVEPQVGITVRGILRAEGTETDRIIFTTASDTHQTIINFPEIRLVDGPSILAGRVQLKYQGKWTSVCTNSKNWTREDMETACRQLGFQGGTFFNWFNRQMPLTPRLLYEEPKCSGRESSMFDCNWRTREMGSGVCDYHPDIGIECLPFHDQPLPFWRGIRFEHSKSKKVLSTNNTLFMPRSLSILKYTNIYYAGAGRDQNATSALHIEGVPPILEYFEIINSAYNAINITKPEAPIRINNCTLRNNRGYGVFINSSFGLGHLDSCTVNQNGGDGIRYVHAQERPNERVDRYGYEDFCQLAVAASQTFPLNLFVEQTISRTQERRCENTFGTRYGHVLTLDFIRAVTERNDTADIEIYDGTNLNKRIISKFPIRNNTRPQSITTTTNKIFIRFRADPLVNMIVFLRVISGPSKSYELNISNSDVSENIGRGIAIDDLRSQIHVHKSSISKNEHVAGIHVTSGVGDVNVTDSRIAFNEGDGINVTYTGGSRNISRTIISSNKGYGVAIWLNNTEETEYIFVNQTSVVQYSEIYKNLDIGVLHGNYCSETLFINITGNLFKNSLSDALEILTCWIPIKTLTRIQIGHNRFYGNERLALKIYPAVNLLGIIEYNHFRQGTFGAVLIKNKPLEEFNALVSDILVQQNYFLNNTGIFVANLALSAYAQNQYLLFTRNFVKNNKIQEPFQPSDGSISKLIPRSRVAAPVVVGSDNIDIFRNIIENPDSKYEIGSHLGDQSKTINCTYNWLGYSEDKYIFHRIFHRYDRYNLAKIAFVPFLLHNSNPSTTKINVNVLFVPKFENNDKVGGEIEGEETLAPGEYIVERDISIRPGGKLTIDPGVVLRFPPSIGMMVGGSLEARGIGPDSIKFTLKEEIVHPVENDTYEVEISKNGTEFDPLTEEPIVFEPLAPIRLLGGISETEGRLQVKINGEWGTVCNYGWTIQNAALVCQQLGLVLNPDDWNLEPNEIPDAGTTERVILSNVQCDDYDLDITKCKSETIANFENSCSHENDVGVRCYSPSWAGVRFGPLAKRTDIQYVTIEKAGLLDYATNSFKPALQLDFARQNFENINVVNNYYHGLGVMYSNIYTNEDVNNIKTSKFLNNKGAGISLKQLGLQISGSLIEHNYIGIKHNPMLTSLQQRELAGWFLKNEDDWYYNPFIIPDQSDRDVIYIQQGDTKYFITRAVHGNNYSRLYRVQCPPGWVIGIQLLNPIENRSTEVINIVDALTYTMNTDSDIWKLHRDLTIFPTTSSSHGILMEYDSGNNAIGGTVIVLSSIKAPIQNVYNRIVKGPVPTLSIKRTKIRNNDFGIHNSFYNRYLDELGNRFLRKANETIKLINCEISFSAKEAIFTHSPYWDLHRSNLSEIKLMINNSLIVDNTKGIYHFSRDMRASNNLFHYILQDNTIERNHYGGLELNLPYVWQYNENFTHSVYLDNNSWIDNRRFGINIGGHYAVVNITNSIFKENQCKTGLLIIDGMEKKLKIFQNKFLRNTGQFIVQFNSDSQSEILGDIPAKFTYNDLRDNRFVQRNRAFGVLQLDRDPSHVIGFKGIQKVKIKKNLFSNNLMDYQLLAGIKTAKINNFLDATENWWGSDKEEIIKKAIFDFDDWNNYAVVQFQPYLLEDNFQSSFSLSYSTNTTVDLNNLGGRLYEDLTLSKREYPYIIRSDLTIMPKATLTIYPDVVLEFAPNVGMLVLGSLKARGYKGHEIIMKSADANSNLENSAYKYEIDTKNKRYLEHMETTDGIRLCKSRSCVDEDSVNPNEGFLEYFNKTTLQWIPLCDPRFTERNAQVVCRELGFDPLDAYFDHDIRIDFHSNSLSRIWIFPEPLQCKGTEKRFSECPIRLNGQQFGHRHRCEWNSKFVFVHCNKRRIKSNYWGGVRFADAEFEQQLYAYRIHDTHTHTTLQTNESYLEYVKILDAGILHNEKSPAVQSILKSPSITYVTVLDSAFHGINLISPSQTMNLFYNEIQNSMGVGLNIVSLSGEGRESEESSFMPLRELNIPYNLFGMLDICDTNKEVYVEERILLYYKYDNNPVNCIKIFKSSYINKPLAFRLLQFNLFNSTTKSDLPDYISLHDGDIYNVTSTIIDKITMTSRNEKKFFKSKLPSLSVKLFANGASSEHGFIAEVVTLPLSTIAFNRDVQHNISHSVINNNAQGALLYMAAGEVNPIVTIEKNQFTYNCKKLYGNFTTCKSAIEMDLQNTQTLYFRNNLVEGNQGGLYIKADSRSSATSLRAWIHNNLFVKNYNLPALYVEGRQSSPYQEVIIYRNYFTRNAARFKNNIILRQVVSNFTYNYVKRNVGFQNMEISGFDKVRLNIYQTTTHNGFYNNFATNRDSRSTIVAGTAGQHYVDNIFFDPDNDYEMVTVNRSLFEFNSTMTWNTRIDAANNYWGFNTTLAVRGRIRDQSDDPKLLEVIYEPYYMNNKSILNVKCPPGWDLVGETCYMYVGAPMTFTEAKSFCEADNASMPYLLGNVNYLNLYYFLRKQHQWYLYTDKVWVQHIDKINECTIYAYQTVEIDDCNARNPFICEIDPKVTIKILPLADDFVTISVISSCALAVLLLILVIVCWYNKSKFRKVQRLERQNSIRQSLHSLRSVGLSTGTLTDQGYRRRPGQLSSRSTDTLTKNSDYKKMVSNGSFDSVSKSINSSIEDTHSLDLYETTNQNPSAFAYNPSISYQKSPSKFENQYAKPTTFDLGYRNEGFRDNSTFASSSNFHSLGGSVHEGSTEETPIITNEPTAVYEPSDYYNSDTLPLNNNFDKSNSTLEMKRGIEESNKRYDPSYSRSRPTPSNNLIQELNSKFGYNDNDSLPSKRYSPEYEEGTPPESERVLETDFNGIDKPSLKYRTKRAKSEALLETDFDYTPPGGSPAFNHPISEAGRSKSQPLETAM